LCIIYIYIYIYIQGDQKVSVNLMIKIQKVSWLTLSALQPIVRARGTLDSH
jgi:hypothetical protein